MVPTSLTGKPRLGGGKVLTLPKPHTQGEVEPVPAGGERTPLPSVSGAGSCSPCPLSLLRRRLALRCSGHHCLQRW